MENSNVGYVIEQLHSAEKPLYDEKRYEVYKAANSTGDFYRNDLLRVLVLGRFKAGKSSLINAIIGKEIAAVDVLEKTAWIARYWPSTEEFCYIYHRDGMCEREPIDIFLKKTKEDTWTDNQLADIYRIDVGYSGESNSFGIIDTPGFGSANEDNEKRAMEAIKDADLIIYVADINKIGNQREMAIVSSIKNNDVPMICVANKYDGDIAHHKNEEEAVKMVSKYSGFETDDIYLMSTKAYKKNNEKAIKFMNNILTRIKNAQVIGDSLREKSKEANDKRIMIEEYKLLLQAYNELYAVKKSRIRIEDNYAYNQKIIKTELSNHIKDYIRNTMYADYRGKVIEAIEAEIQLVKSNNIKTDFSGAIEKVLPSDYMENYWEEIKKEISCKNVELWNRHKIELDNEEYNIATDLKNHGIDISVAYNGGALSADPAYDANISEKVIDKSFKAAGFVSFCTLMLGGTLGGAVLLGAPIALVGMWLAGGLRNKSSDTSEQTNANEMLTAAVNQYADMVANYTVSCLTQNAKGILSKRLELFDKEAEKRLPSELKIDESERIIHDCLVYLEQNVDETQDTRLLKMAIAMKKREIESFSKTIDLYNDKKIEYNAQDDVLSISKLNSLIGLNPVKKRVSDMIASVKMQQEKIKAGLTSGAKARHMVFTGNPGTGKTEVARLIGAIYKDLGILKKGQFVEASRKDLVSEYTGQTSTLTQKVCESALGGVLFIDEAYTLYKKDSQVDYGQEAIDTLLKFMEDNRDDIVVIIAGYKEQINDFLTSNPGLESRFSEFIDFPDYSAKELTQIFQKMCSDNGYLCDSAVIKTVDEYMEYECSHKKENFSNARMVRRFFEQTIIKQEKRLFSKSVYEKNDLKMLKTEDLGVETKNTDYLKHDYLDELDSMIGLSTVKTRVREMINVISVNKIRREQGINNESMSMHMVFSGNPGTGKTHVARLIAKIFYQKGIIATDRFVEADRTTLVASYVGQTASKTLDICNKALDGVLFIDEAYSLSEHDAEYDFGQEAIDTLLKFMEDNRDRIVVIVAGYNEKMVRFLNSNPGLKSRFATTIEFPDYSPNEMMSIFDKLCNDNTYVMTDECRKRVYQKINSIYDHREDNFANGREVRNMFENIVLHQKNRLANKGDFDNESLITLIAADVF